MNNILIKLIKGKTPTRREIEEELYNICDSVHSSCSDDCPVYNLNHGTVNPQKSFEENRGCDCFKNGKAMFNFLSGLINRH